MRFVIAEEVFATLPNVCFGAVAVKGVDNTTPRPTVTQILEESIAASEKRLAGVNLKEAPEILPYREAFRSLGMNPNKFMCSIEALLSRIAKGKGFPEINPLVDLGNAVSLKYGLPIGAHDMGTVAEALEVRAARPGDQFIPFGGTETELPEPGELIYVAGQAVRTRRWIWRQSELGKITAETSHLLFPIDGFLDVNQAQMQKASAELAECLQRIFGVTAGVGFLDQNHPVFTFG